MIKRLITFFVVIISFIFIVQISRSIYSLWQKGSLITEQEAILRQKQAENNKLKQKLSDVESPEFIEKEAREKLNLQKEGEVVVVLPKNLPQAGTATSVSQNLPNWQKWWQLLF